MANRTKLTPRRLKAFLDTIVETGGNITKACKKIHVARATMYERRQENPEFKKQWDEAVDRGIDVLEDEAKRRAYDGVIKPLFHDGKRIGSVRTYSDMLMALMLKAHRTKYKDRHEISGPGGEPLQSGVVTFYLPGKKPVGFTKETNAG